MIVYKCNTKMLFIKRFRRYVKMRVSDKNKRRDQFLRKIRGYSYWWKQVD